MQNRSKGFGEVSFLLSILHGLGNFSEITDINCCKNCIIIMISAKKTTKTKSKTKAKSKTKSKTKAKSKTKSKTKTKSREKT